MERLWRRLVKATGNRPRRSRRAVSLAVRRRWPVWPTPQRPL